MNILAYAYTVKHKVQFRGGGSPEWLVEIKLSFVYGLVTGEVLTYMSMRVQIQNVIADGRLFCLPPLIQSSPAVRAMFVSVEVNSVLQPPWPQSPEGYRHSQTRGYLDTWTEGRLISVALHPYRKHKSAFLARIDPTDDDVWDFRCIDPTPGVRVLGCFSEQDTFVALTWNFRENLDDERAWRNERERCKAAWSNLFHPYPPFRGDTIHDYISSKFHLV